MKGTDCIFLWEKRFDKWKIEKGKWKKRNVLLFHYFSFHSHSSKYSVTSKCRFASNRFLPHA